MHKRKLQISPAQKGEFLKALLNKEAKEFIKQLDWRMQDIAIETWHQEQVASKETENLGRDKAVDNKAREIDKPVKNPIKYSKIERSNFCIINGRDSTIRNSWRQRSYSACQEGPFWP